ncbi:hypothetical protein ASD24_24815 [Paenibacillus sp. Root52]|uniref:hypothetical protein n=1 Tax=Paenibacillus sp. Root52 TaxID=1736552 RepID=UPI0006F8C78B|nr:hypothetical protein [Paenibacillus sp. Root52]KQY91021.1 hypothetical protein ASD24_24815 [Paenibacillus sp. Root52]
MKKAYFIGDYEKSDLLFYLAKVLSITRRVLLVDATKRQHYHYLTPRIEDEPGIVTYDGFDVFTGSEDELNKQRIGAYDHVLYDIDDADRLPVYRSTYRFFFVTSMDITSIMRGEFLIQQFTKGISSNTLPFYKLLIEDARTPGEAYIDELLSTHPIIWEETLSYMPEDRDRTQKINNQYTSKLHMKQLSSDMRHLITKMVQVVDGTDAKSAAQHYKQAERRK